MSADWTAGPSAVPYASLTNPQSLNLYAYLGNDPIDGGDPDGHARYDKGSSGCAAYASLCSAGGEYGEDNPMLHDSIEQMEQEAQEMLAMQQQQAGNGANTPQTATTPASASAQQNANRQPDGYYKATPAQLAEIEKADKNRKTTIGNGECVTACEKFTGVPGPTASWRGGKPATELTDKDRGTAIATFIKGSDGEWHYLPDPGGNKNSGTFWGTGTKGTFWMADQWPDGQKPVSV